MNDLKCPNCNHKISNKHIIDWLEEENEKAQKDLEK